MTADAAEFSPPRDRPGVTLLVDARALRASGIGRYLREVLAALLRDPRFARVTLLGDPRELHEFVAGIEPVTEVRIETYPGGFYSIRTQFAWLRRALRGANRADVAFFPHYDAPLFARPRRRVVTVHDLTHFKAPEGFAWWRRAAAAVLLRRAVSGAARVVTGSEATRRDLAERVPGVDERTVVVPYGCSPVFHALDADASGCFAGLQPFLLCVGNRKPHKNLVAAVETLALLKPERPELQLVFAGRAFPGWERVLDRAGSFGIREAIVDLGEVSDDELRGLYARCEALLFPSLYEGFGLPVLEAMACGAPVIASNRASLPEVVGNAGIMIDPSDAREISAAVRRLRSEPRLRETLMVRGRRRAKEFAWDHTREKTAETLLRAALPQ